MAWDEDVQPAGGTAPVNDQFVHVLRTSAGRQILGPLENLDVSVTHCAGQYVAQPAWPAVCGPLGYSDRPVTDAEGKDCNVFHGDYTGLAVDSADRVHVVWTGLNRFDQSLQRDPYTGGPHDGYVQDAMYARREQRADDHYLGEGCLAGRPFPRGVPRGLDLVVGPGGCCWGTSAVAPETTGSLTGAAAVLTPTGHRARRPVGLTMKAVEGHALGDHRLDSGRS